MICFPNAKINLGLNVVSKRPDGYHNIETIFYPIPVKDALEIVASDQPSFTGTGIPVDAPQEKNLVIKALNALKTRYEIPPARDPFVESDTFWRRAWRRFRRCRFYVEAGQ